MLLIADAGASKTDWCLLDSEGNIAKEFTSKGINSNYLSKDEILHRLSDAFLSLENSDVLLRIKKVHYFGSGCSTEQKQFVIEDCVAQFAPNADIMARHDIWGAAISLCGDNQGIACILGTGSNVCIYDGKKVVETPISVGYLLGDEGSGTHIGKKIITAYLKKKMPQHLQSAFEKDYHFSPFDMLPKLYEHANVGTLLASFAPFAVKYNNDEFIQSIVKESFMDFFKEQLLPYPQSKEMKIHFAGSIAKLFEPILRQQCQELNLRLGNVIQKPILGLIKYYQSKY
ncbi:MAG: hypothetical protein LBR36_00590 [Bacteroidales bacterium]|jgi:N-acetylglucosamine kinase-like BadF-type ATPase|nr:hypothetical protein [Bacteroidales bacterium]